MILYLFGSDTYRRQQKVIEIVTVFSKKNPSANIQRLEYPEIEISSLEKEIETQSLFAKKKLVILHIQKAPTEKAKFKKALSLYAENKEVTLLLTADKSLGKGFEFLLKAPVKKDEYEPMEGKKREVFFLAEAKKRGVVLTAQQLRALMSEEDMWSAMTQLDVIASGGSVSESPANPDFFPLLQTVASARVDVAKRLIALQQLLTAYDAAAAFNVLAAIVPIELKGVFADYDIRKKLGKLDYDDALFDFILSVK